MFRDTAAPPILLVARSAEHRASLGRYLEAAGLVLDANASLDTLRQPRVAPRGPVLAVVITEGFSPTAVLDALGAWWEPPGRPVVLVSETPTRFQPGALPRPGGERPCVVLSAPCFGWHLLDAIRGLLPSSAPASDA